jgi:16S rRNA (uracil1498-N3)-methyltransferase
VAGVAAHVFVDDVEAPVLRDDDRHHLERVLRLRDGEAVTASDGRGGVRPCSWAGGSLRVAGEVERTPPPSPALGVGFALVKGEKPEWIVQKLTECGVDRIVPFVAERSVVRWDAAKAARNHERLARVAVEAAMQSRRVWLPVVEPVRPFADVVAGAWLADAAGAAGPTSEVTTLLVGPEGGWSPAELAAADGRFVRFGENVLRAETAAVAAGVLLAAVRSGAVRPADGRASRS